MRRLLLLALVVGIASTAAAADLGGRAPVKVPAVAVNVPDPLRQGGDTIATATVIPYLPYNDAGTTVGYTDDYTGVCLYDNNAPDVVYAFTADHPDLVTISLCGSSYDTGLYVYDASLTEIACNDDYCGLQSQLENVPVNAGQTYYIVIDGYGSGAGDYLLSAWYHDCGLFICPPEGTPEGEPPLVDNYVDSWNGGCSTNAFQQLAGDDNGDLLLCGVAGWYHVGDTDYRDTDWFILTMGPGGTIELNADGEYATYFYELGPQDCAAVTVLQAITAGPCSPAAMTITGYVPGAPVWFWVGSTAYADPDGGDNEYDYMISFSGLAPGPIAVESATWSAVKALYE